MFQHAAHDERRAETLLDRRDGRGLRLHGRTVAGGLVSVGYTDSQIGRQITPAGRFRVVRVFAHSGGPT
jgi:hypothetical protein